MFGRGKCLQWARSQTSLSFVVSSVRTYGCSISIDPPLGKLPWIYHKGHWVSTLYNRLGSNPIPRSTVTWIILSGWLRLVIILYVRALEEMSAHDESFINVRNIVLADRAEFQEELVTRINITNGVDRFLQLLTK